MAVSLEELTKDIDNEFGTLYLAEIDGEKSVAVFTLNTPWRVINPGVMAQMNAALDRIEGDADIAGLITYHEHGPFSNGFDLVLMRDIMQLDIAAAEQQVAGILTQGQQLFDRLYTFPKPTVAAIGGWCVGGGYELALGHTYLMGADNTNIDDPFKPWTFKLQLPEVKHVGLIPGWNGIPALLRRTMARKTAGKQGTELKKAYDAVMKTTVEPMVLNGYGPDNAETAVKRGYIDEAVQRDFAANGNNGALLEAAIYKTLDLADSFTANTLEPLLLQPPPASAVAAMDAPQTPADYALRCLYSTLKENGATVPETRDWATASGLSSAGIAALARQPERQEHILKYINAKVLPMLTPFSQGLAKMFAEELKIPEEEVLKRQPWLRPWG
ncbi:enoyl-CoA hydratase/isomerase family protein [Candidatus Woesearchaeota archaeon]|nr:enoyl-CoA hydratase/isomerase family protein [Candidatus Woesearchaeota archaeon]